MSQRRCASLAAAEKCTATRIATGNPRGAQLKVRGDDHPKSRGCWTPKGRFGSIALAAEALGITRQGAMLKIKRGTKGWRYEIE